MLSFSHFPLTGPTIREVHFEYKTCKTFLETTRHLNESLRSEMNKKKLNSNRNLSKTKFSNNEENINAIVLLLMMLEGSWSCQM